MPSLAIPKAGLSLDPSLAKGGFDAYNVTLPDNVIEDMIKCVRNGKGIQLSLGPNPVLSYSDNEQHFAYNEDTFTTELYRSEFDTTTTSNAPKMPIFNSKFSIFQPKRLVPTSRPASSASASVDATNATAAVTAGSDSALATLQNSMAKENAKKSNNSIKYIKDGTGLPPPVQQRGPAKPISNTKRFLSANSKSHDTTRSMPTSPSLSGVDSPSLNPTSTPSSTVKTIRASLIHELAIGPATEKELAERMDKQTTEIASTLDKVADADGDKYKLRNKCYKELDVFKYPYESHALRQTAIDNAVKAFDKLRMGTGEPEWEKLLPVKERGTGKCLSKLQTKIAETAVQRALPKPAKLPKPSKSPNPQSKDTDGNEDGGKLSPKKIDNRSNSQPPISNKKRVSEKEAQTKRLLGRPPKAQASKQKASANQEKFKSSEFVNDSDDDDDSVLQPPAPISAPAPAPAKKTVSTPQPISSSHSKPAKRTRDDDIDNSAPKKTKKTSDDVEKVIKHRMSDASRTSLSTNASSTSISTSASASSKKTTSPQKSSPLASSPANADDIDAAYVTSTSSDRSPDGSKTHRSKVIHGRVTKVNTRDRGLQWKRDWKKYIHLREELLAYKVKDKEWERKCRFLRDMHARLAREKEGFWRDYRASS